MIYLLLAGLIATSIAGAGVAVGSEGPEPPGDKNHAHDVATTAAEFLQLAYGISAQEAQVRLSRQQEAQNLANALQQTLPDTYAGGWIDNARGGAINLRLKGDVPSAARQLIGSSPAADFVQLRPASSSLRELTDVADLLREDRDSLDALSHSSQPVGFGINVMNNSVDIYVPVSERSVGSVEEPGLAEPLDTLEVDIRWIDDSMRVPEDEDVCTRDQCPPPLRGGIPRTIRTGASITLTAAIPRRP